MGDFLSVLSVQGAAIVLWQFADPPAFRLGISFSIFKTILPLTLSKVTFNFCVSVLPAIKLYFKNVK